MIDQDLLLQRAEKICDFLKQPPYPDIHRTVSIFVTYARALIVNQRPQSNESAEGSNVSGGGDGSVPSYRGPGSPLPNPPPLAAPEYPPYRPGTPIPGNKDLIMAPIPGNDTVATPRPPLPKLPDTMEASN